MAGLERAGECEKPPSVLGELGERLAADALRRGDASAKASCLRLQAGLLLSVVPALAALGDDVSEDSAAPLLKDLKRVAASLGMARSLETHRGWNGLRKTVEWRCWAKADDALARPLLFRAFAGVESLRDLASLLAVSDSSAEEELFTALREPWDEAS